MWICAYPAIHDGHEVAGIELRFDRGRVVEAKASVNQGFLLDQLDVDDGARYLGEFAIATNKQTDRFTRNILFDEKIGGTVHLELGNGFPDAGSKNTSGIHWDMICDMRGDGQIKVDGELVYNAGEFKVLLWGRGNPVAPRVAARSSGQTDNGASRRSLGPIPRPS